MKKLSFKFFTSFILTILFVIALGGRGYAKDNLLNEVKDKANNYYDSLASSVVQIINVGSESISYGTGVFIDDDKTIVTNYHVIRGADFIFFKFRDNSFAYNAKVIASDEKNDIALLTSKDEFEYKYLNLTDKNKRNQIVISCGYSLDYTVSEGIVLKTEKICKYNNNYNSYIEISNVLKKGNSGGPILNSKGEIIGIVSLGTNSSTYIVPTYKILNLVNSLG